MEPPPRRAELEDYLGGLAGTDDVPVYAAPGRATDLSGLPPAYVSTAENDPLRDEGILYALRLLQAGVSVELHQFPGTFHGSALVTTAAMSKRAQHEAALVLRRRARGDRRLNQTAPQQPLCVSGAVRSRRPSEKEQPHGDRDRQRRR